MAWGDIGGAITELVITCRPLCEIRRGDAVTLRGPYEVSTGHDADVPFGIATQDSRTHGADSVPIQVRGVCRFRYQGHPPAIASRVFMGSGGAVRSTTGGMGAGCVVKVDEAGKECEVLL